MRTPQVPQWLRPTTLLVGTLMLTSAAFAQTTTASLRGVVRDASGPVPTAKVEAADVASGLARAVAVAENGSYIFPGLKPGSYQVTVSAEAFASQQRTVQLQVGQDLVVDFTLAPSESVSEGITVIAEAAPLETRTSEIATNITTQQMEGLPQNSRNFLSFAALAPGVRFTDDQDKAGQSFKSGGADSRQVNVYIDGLSYKNDLLQGGAMMQDSSRGNPFPQNAVQEYRVLTQNYKAEYEKAAAAIITAVTKSGSNAYQGDVFYSLQNKSMVSQDEFAEARGEEKADYDRKQGGLSVGGPIIRDRLHFFVSYESNDQDRNASVFRGSSYASAPANVQQLLGTYPTGTLTSPFESKLYFGKLSWQPAESQTLDVSFNLRDEQEIRGYGGQRTRDGAESFEIGTDALVAKHTAVLGSMLFNEASLAVQHTRWNPTAIESSTPRMNYIGILDVGGKDATQDFQQDRVGIRDDLTWSTDWHGAHTVKAGLSAAKLNYKIKKELFANGYFEFRSDEQWQIPFQARIGFGNPGLEFDNKQLGLYLQDDWQPLDNLTLNLGVRWDYESNMINNDYVTPPSLVAAMHDSCRTYDHAVGGQTTWCFDDFFDFGRLTTDGNDRDAYYGMVQPRIGFAWDVRRNGQTVVFGGWGKYYDRVVLNDIFDEQYRQSWTTYSFCFSADGSPAPNCGAPTLRWNPSYLSADGLRALIASGQAPGPEIWLVRNDLKPPRTDQYTLGVRQQFGHWQTSLSYAGVQGYNGLIYFFGDLPPGTAFDDRWGGAVGVPGYARIFTTSTARRTWYNAAYLTLDRPRTGDSRWGFNLAYTYADGKQNGTDYAGDGLAFGAFDYRSPDDFYKFPATNSERHRLVMSGTVALPARFEVSSMITLGSGTPFTVYDDSAAPFRVAWNEGEPEKFSFIIPNAWAYRSVDLRLQWTAPPIADRVNLSLVAEGFNIFDYSNYNAFESFKPRLPNVNDKFGQGTAAFNTRRFQLGARVSF